MKIIIAGLALLLLLLQYELWFGQGGIRQVWQLKHNISHEQAQLQQWQQRNQVLVADIKDLKAGNQAVASRARNELGMIKKGEVFYQIVQ